MVHFNHLKPCPQQVRPPTQYQTLRDPKEANQAISQPAVGTSLELVEDNVSDLPTPQAAPNLVGQGCPSIHRLHRPLRLADTQQDRGDLQIITTIRSKSGADSSLGERQCNQADNRSYMTPTHVVSRTPEHPSPALDLHTHMLSCSPV